MDRTSTRAQPGSKRTRRAPARGCQRPHRRRPLTGKPHISRRISASQVFSINLFSVIRGLVIGCSFQFKVELPNPILNQNDQ